MRKPLSSFSFTLHVIGISQPLKGTLAPPAGYVYLSSHNLVYNLVYILVFNFIFVFSYPETIGG